MRTQFLPMVIVVKFGIKQLEQTTVLRRRGTCGVPQPNFAR